MKRFRTPLIAAILFSVGSTAQAAVMYSLVDLGTLGGNTSSPLGMNDLGQVVGYSDVSGNGIHHAFLYSDGTMTDLGTFGGQDSEAFGINDSGQVVGTAGNGTADNAFLYNGSGPLINLGTLGGPTSIAQSINNAGQIVGWAENASQTRYAFAYSGNGPMQNLGTLAGGNFSQANAINNAGQIAGFSNVNGGSTLYSILMNNNNSPMQNLGSFGGSDSDANAINNAGEVVGYSTNSEGNLHAFLYTGSGSLIDLGTLGGAQSEAYAINDLGEIGGGSDTANGGHDAFIYMNGTMTDLNSLISPSSGWTLTGVAAINDAGWITGNGTAPDGFNTAYLLIPVPEPSTIVLFGVGIVGLLIFAVRRQMSYCGFSVGK